MNLAVDFRRIAPPISCGAIRNFIISALEMKELDFAVSNI